MNDSYSIEKVLMVPIYKKNRPTKWREPRGNEMGQPVMIKTMNGKRNEDRLKKLIQKV